MHVEPSSLEQSREAPLPPGVTRNRNAGKRTTLEDCHAVQLYVTPHENNGTSRSFIIWRDSDMSKGINIRPVAKKRITELRAGDLVMIDGVETQVVGLEVWR
jgi:hypothetical protein